MNVPILRSCWVSGHPPITPCRCMVPCKRISSSLQNDSWTVQRVWCYINLSHHIDVATVSSPIKGALFPLSIWHWLYNCGLLLGTWCPLLVLCIIDRPACVRFLVPNGSFTSYSPPASGPMLVPGALLKAQIIVRALPLERVGSLCPSKPHIVFTARLWTPVGCLINYKGVTSSGVVFGA